MEQKMGNPYPCRGCGQQIRMITMRMSKRPMPVNAEKIKGDGWRTLVTEDGECIPKAGVDLEGYEPHWGFCRRATQFRKTKERA